MTENTKLNTQFVFIPYSVIPDSIVKIKRSEVEAYIKKNSADFKVEDARDISYVKFDIVATAEDENAIKTDVASLIEEFKASNNDKEFLNQNDSDVNLDENYKYQNQVTAQVAPAIFKGAKGDVFGPYKDQGFFKISKITEVTKMPDSAKASHILIPFIGAQRVAPNVTRTEEEAKKTADSIFNLVRRSKSKFATLAKELSSDTGSAQKDGDLGWFPYNRMTPDFRDFVFQGKKGEVGVVKTPFGFHIIRIDDLKDEETVLKLATYGRKIVPSEATENAVFQKAEQFALEVSKGNNFSEIAKENKFVTKPAIGLKVLDENVPGLGNQRQIVRQR